MNRLKAKVMNLKTHMKKLMTKMMKMYRMT